MNSTAPRDEHTPGKITELNTYARDDIFRYTSGRWLINEKHQLDQRFVEFSIDKLCSRAAAIFGPKTKCVRVVKIEGNSNKAFLLTMDDGNEVIAKIPCPNVGAPLLTTASEVATLKFLRSRISIRVPEVYAWDSDSSNPVGAEYIIMEKICGVALAEKWESMNSLQRYEIINQIVKMEKEFRSLKLPAYGRFSYEIPYHPNTIVIHSPRIWTQMDCSALAHRTVDCCVIINLQKYPNLLLGHKELALIATERDRIQSLLNQFDTHQSVDEYSDLLQKATQVLPYLSKDLEVLKWSDSVIWHNDLHLGNIYISPDDPTIIKGVIDWQSIEACPLFTQVQFPEFLRPPKSYCPGTEIPKLPDNFDDLDPDEKETAKEEHALATQSKYYEMYCLGYNIPVYNAMKLDRRLWEPFVCCELPSTGFLVPLRNSLILIFQDWNLLGFSDIIKGQLRTDDNGWVPIERWEATNKMNEYLFDTYIKTMNGEMSPDMAKKTWPFPTKGA
ncbi:phosphotransferase enzyme family protein [Trichophyton equinum CBS 127.97]|uniref:Altered inheritance of mitochondria protein 9, mitochondrial n=1 Tax=Trichophyton equinum (strain ATCC MYA-4606 / CBS 127.97) TaxID=559882 RepID=F2PZ36_TRIEC|nr:phosphotransferase enzyme family protein [Trichophyton equinum CBS 127.97]